MPVREASPSMPPSGDDPDLRDGYVAVVYCHGMGSQRRLEETSRLIDALDRYSNAMADDSVGRLVKIQAMPEPQRGGGAPGDTVSFIRSFFSQKLGGRWTRYRQVRFYEFYWAPVMAGKKSPWPILWWMVSQVFRPWRTLGSHWRERQRLRRAALAELFEPRRDGSTGPAGAQPGDLDALIGLYDRFERPDMLRRFPKGSFAQFLAMIAEADAGDPDRAARLTRLARAWHRHYFRSELRNLLVLGSAVLALGLMLATVLILISLGLTALSTIRIDNPLIQMIAHAFRPDLKTALAVAASLAMLLGLGRFLTDSMGDVEAWSTYQETDIKYEARKKVIAEGVALLTHVLSDARCKRVVLVSHSLGTTILHDTLLALARRNRAANSRDPLAAPLPLNRIEHFVTLGSPIDKVEYFFESYASASHRYKRAVEDLRGDIGTPPFSTARHVPHVHWINFWDEGDIISGPLQSPTSRYGAAARVDNVHVRTLRFPDPAASHLGYFDNRTVIETLFGIVYRREASYQLPGATPANTRLAPGEPHGAGPFFQSVAIALPWLVLAAALFVAIHGRQSFWAILPALIATAILAIGFVGGRIGGPRHPN